MSRPPEGRPRHRVMDGPLPAGLRLKYTDLTTPELARRLDETLRAGVHGLCFSAYLDGQGPDRKSQLGRDQLRSRMSIIAPSTRWVRTFACSDGNELSPGVAREFGLKTMVGAWIGDDPEANARELAGLVELARAGQVDIAAVGNEVLLRGDVPEDVVLEALLKTKAALPGVPVGIVDAYTVFVAHPRLVEASDVLLVNCYPFWEECSLEHSMAFMQEMVSRVRSVARGKPIVIAETGWPSAGSAVGAAEPSERNALLYALNSFEWAAAEDLALFYFSTFDEAWKAGPEGNCGAHWGLWDAAGSPKYGR
jgi:glucan 1,3-beta-glucosidase